MPLEEIDPDKGFFCSRTRRWTEGANYRASVMSQNMSLFVIFASEASVMVFATQDGAFFWASIDRLGSPEIFDEKLSTIEPIHIPLCINC